MTQSKFTAGELPREASARCQFMADEPPEYATARGEVTGAYSDLKFILERGNLRANNNTSQKNILPNSN
jgi:hypothetical protein